MDLPAVSGQTVYRSLAFITLIGAFAEPTWRRFIWALFTWVLFVAAEKFKDVEKIKRKTRDETIIEMRQKIVDEDRASIDGQYKFVTDQIANAFESALRQLSTYVKDASPTRRQ